MRHSRTRLGTRTPGFRDAPSTDDRGYVMVLVALLIPVLIGIAALAVDIGMWYVEKADQQKAADAAALAGAKYLPDDPTTAVAEALKFAAANGYTNGASPDGHPITVTAAPTAQRSQLKVTISRDVDNYFAPVLGFNTQHISTPATAEFMGPIPMGSPCNRFGNEPLGPTDTAQSSSLCGSTASQWVNVAGPESLKQKGDALQGGTCLSGDDGCSAVGKYNNTDYSQNGYFYVVRVTDAAAGNTLRITAFDPAFVQVGDKCDQYTVPNADPRYARGATSQYCTGDQIFTDSAETGGAARPPVTSFAIRGPGDELDPLLRPVLATKQFTGVGSANWTPDLNAVVNSSGAAGVDRTVGDVWRKWVTLATIPNAQAGDYLVQVRANVAPGGDPAGAGGHLQGSGHNRFSLRASVGSPAANAGVAIYGYGHQGMYANADGTTRFALVRIPSAAAGRALNLRFFDIGDATSTTFKVLPPTESSTPFVGCTASGAYSGNRPNCDIVNAVANGKWVNLRVPIPPTYTCNDGGAGGCWVRIEINYGAPTDTTTWTASMEGDPLRLIK